MEFDESCVSTISAEIPDQTKDKLNLGSNNADQKDKMTNLTNRLSRKEFRKLMKKQRKKNARIEAAKAKQQRQEEGEEETFEAVIEAKKVEEKKKFERDLTNKLFSKITYCYFIFFGIKKKKCRKNIMGRSRTTNHSS